MWGRIPWRRWEWIPWRRWRWRFPRKRKLTPERRGRAPVAGPIRHLLPATVLRVPQVDTHHDPAVAMHGLETASRAGINVLETPLPRPLCRGGDGRWHSFQWGRCKPSNFRRAISKPGQRAIQKASMFLAETGERCPAGQSEASLGKVTKSTKMLPPRET